MTPIDNLDQLLTFIHSNPDPRELKRAVAVYRVLEGHKHHEIKDQLGVTSGFISKWKTVYATHGIDGLKLAYKGKHSYLTADQRQEAIAWIKTQPYCTIEQLKRHLLIEYRVAFKSKTSYYQLLHVAGKY